MTMANPCSSAKNTITLATIMVLVVQTLAPAAIVRGEAREMMSSQTSGKTSIRIINEIGAGVNLTVHCKSGDDDIGTRILALYGTYEFKFNPNFFGGTLFHCQIDWPNNPHRFDTYVQSRDAQRCHSDCCWNIIPRGPCDCHTRQCFSWN